MAGCNALPELKEAKQQRTSCIPQLYKAESL